MNYRFNWSSVSTARRSLSTRSHRRTAGSRLSRSAFWTSKNRTFYRNGRSGWKVSWRWVRGLPGKSRTASKSNLPIELDTVRWIPLWGSGMPCCRPLCSPHCPGTSSIRLWRPSTSSFAACPERTSSTGLLKRVRPDAGLSSKPFRFWIVIREPIDAGFTIEDEFKVCKQNACLAAPRR